MSLGQENGSCEKMKQITPGSNHAGYYKVAKVRTK